MKLGFLNYVQAMKKLIICLNTFILLMAWYYALVINQSHHTGANPWLLNCIWLINIPFLISPWRKDYLQNLILLLLGAGITLTTIVWYKYSIMLQYEVWAKRYV